MNIVIVGRPNVGKSTLFNRLTKSHTAVIHNSPGITRDYKEAQASIGDLSFKIIDTAGLYTSGKLSEFNKSVNAKTEIAISRADLMLFVVDGKEGLNVEDSGIARYIRKKNKPIILLANKADTKAVYDNIASFQSLGFHDVCAVSAEHGTGLGDLYALLIKNLPTLQDLKQEKKPENVIRLSILGRPNVGKSTLVNSIIKEDRLLTADMPGTTRDSIVIDTNFKDYKIEIVDTAGLRKKRKIEKEGIEKLFTAKSLDSAFSSDVVVLMVDINSLLEYQDLKIADLIINRGKPIILVVNKQDTIKSPELLVQIKDEFKYLINKKMSSMKTLPVLYISALYKKNIQKILKTVVEQYELWSTKIPSSVLNRWLEQMIEEHQPPMSKLGTRVKLKYMNQVSSSPCVFQIFVNRPQELPKSYINYLATNLRKDFNMQGVPVKIKISKSENPYKD